MFFSSLVEVALIEKLVLYNIIASGKVPKEVVFCFSLGGSKAWLYLNASTLAQFLVVKFCSSGNGTLVPYLEVI